MTIIQDASAATKLRRKYALHGEAIVPTLAPEIVPIAIVDDLSAPVESDTEFMRVATGGASNAASAGNYSPIQLLNPAGSEIIAIVGVLMVSRGSAGYIQVLHHDTALTTALNTKGWADRRIAGGPVAELRRSNPAAIPGNVRGLLEAPAAEMVTVPLEFVLAPGQGIVMCPSTVNVASAATYIWAERGILPGEA